MGLLTALQATKRFFTSKLFIIRAQKGHRMEVFTNITIKYLNTLYNKLAPDNLQITLNL